MPNRVPFDRACRVYAECSAYNCRDVNLERPIATFTRDYVHGERWEWPCFHAIFCFCSNNKAKNIKIHYSYKILKENDGRFNCFNMLTRNEFIRIIRAMKEIVPFSYRVRNPEGQYMYFEADVVGSCREQKAFMMMSRMLFECPHNMAAIDALRMKHDLHHYEGYNFNKMSFINLYLVCLTSNRRYSYDESFVSHPFFVPMSTPEFRKILCKRGAKDISNIFKYNRSRDVYDAFRTMRRIEIDDIDGYRDTFEDRLQVYIQNLNIADESIRALGANWPRCRVD